MRLGNLLFLVLATATLGLALASAPFGTASADVLQGELRVLLMIVDGNQLIPRSLRHFEDGQVTNVEWSDASTIHDYAFERASSFASLFEEMSFGQLVITGDTVHVELPFDASEYTWRQWIQLADDEATSRGVDLSTYDRYLYILPHSLSDVTTAGLSTGDLGWCTPFSYVKLSCLFHELGHTIGFDHAAELLADGSNDGIGDTSDGVMGQGLNCHVSVVNKAQVGWLTGNRLQSFDTPGSASYTLAPQSSPADTLQAIEIVNKGARPAVGVVDTFVSYRDTGGFDGQLTMGRPDLHGDDVFDAVLVHQKMRVYGRETLYLAALTAGDSYDEHGVTVTVDDISGGAATVTVARAPYDPSPFQAVVTPANIDTEAREIHSYDVMIENTNDPASTDFDSHYEATFTSIGPDWVMGWSSGHPKTVPPGETRAFPLFVLSPANAAPGTYFFTVAITEADGDAGPYSVETSASYTVLDPQADTTPPTTPTDLTGTTDGTSVSLTWDPSSDASGWVGYDVLRETGTAVGNWQLLYTTLDPFFTDRSTAEGVPYRYVVRAFDPYYNLSADSDVFTITLGTPDVPGDFNGDGVVELADGFLILAAARAMSMPGTPLWDERMDYDGDGIISGADIGRWLAIWRGL